MSHSHSHSHTLTHTLALSPLHAFFTFPFVLLILYCQSCCLLFPGQPWILRKIHKVPNNNNNSNSNNNNNSNSNSSSSNSNSSSSDITPSLKMITSGSIISLEMKGKRTSEKLSKRLTITQAHPPQAKLQMAAQAPATSTRHQPHPHHHSSSKPSRSLVPLTAKSRAVASDTEAVGGSDIISKCVSTRA